MTVDVYLFQLFSEKGSSLKEGKDEEKATAFLQPQTLLQNYRALKREDPWDWLETPSDYTVGGGLRAYMQVVVAAEKNGDAQTQAEKLLTFFGENQTEAILRYLQDFIQSNRSSRTPVHDACLFELPQSTNPEGPWDQRPERILRALENGIRGVRMEAGGGTSARTGIPLRSGCGPIAPENYAAYTDSQEQRRLTVRGEDVWREDLQRAEKLSKGALPQAIEEIKTLDQWIVFVSVFQQEKTLFDSSLWPRVFQVLPPLVENNAGLWRVLRILHPDQQALVLRTFKGRLPELIKSAVDFRCVLEFLNSAERTFVFEALKDRLPGLIESVYDFRDVLQFLNSHERTFVFKALKDWLPGIIQRVYDFRGILEFLNSDERTFVFEAFKDWLPGLIKKNSDLNHVLEFLNPTERSFVFEGLKREEGQY